MKFTTRFASNILCGLILGTGAINAQADSYDDGLMAFAVGNFQEAGQLFMDAAEQGNRGAEHMLMRLFTEGKLYSSNLQGDTLRWTRKAAEQGIMQAQFALAELYANRMNDPKAAIEWYKKAAAQGHPSAYYKLGLLTQDSAEGQHLLQIAASEFDVFAQKGDAAAQNTLASMYEKGQGMNKNMKLAIKWYETAALQGNATAQLNMGRLYASGNGLPQDTQRATYWLNLAAAQGVEEANFMLSELRRDSGVTVALAM